MPDRDEFINVTKSARAAVAAVDVWLSDPTDEAPLLVERLLGATINATGGVPAYVQELRELLTSFAAAPLLHVAYSALDKVDAFFGSRRANLFDELLARSVAASVATGSYDPDVVLPDALGHVAEALVVDGRGGLVASREISEIESRREDLQRCFRPAAENISRKLQNNDAGATIRSPRPEPVDVNMILVGGNGS